MNLKFHQPDYTACNLCYVICTVHRVTRRGIYISAPSLACKPRTLGAITYQSDEIRILNIYAQR